MRNLVRPAQLYRSGTTHTVELCPDKSVMLGQVKRVDTLVRLVTVDGMNYLDRLSVGTYQLKTTVKNPRPDRRCRHDWRCLPEFEGGSYFSVSDDPYRDGGLVIRKQGVYSHQAVNVDNDLFAALAPHLERVQETPEDLLQRKGWAPLGVDILGVLHQQGAITLEQIDNALEIVLRGGEDDNG